MTVWTNFSRTLSLKVWGGRGTEREEERERKLYWRRNLGLKKSGGSVDFCFYWELEPV